MAKNFYFIVFAMWSGVLIEFVLLKTNALPSTTFAPTTHIVSFVHQQKTKDKSNKIGEFDFERIENNGRRSDIDAMRQTHQFKPHTPLSQLYGRLIQQLDTNLDNNNDVRESYKKSVVPSQTDDLLIAQRNTLHNAEDIFGHNEHHESSSSTKNDSDFETVSMWNRMKQSIPVLEPVKHLLNTVREGTFNQTAHIARQHHQLVNSMVGMGQVDHNESSAIETEEEREMANESTEFQLLDFLGSIVGMFWGILSNIQRIFASSSGNASATLSSSSSSSSSP